MNNINTISKIIIDDNEVIQSVLSGKLNDFSILMERYGKFVFTLLKKIVKNQTDAEDIMQEVFVLAYRNLKLFNSESSFKTWIYKITYNKAISHFRSVKKYKSNFYFNAVEDFDLEYIEKKFESFEENDRKKLIDSALDYLEEDERSIVLFFYFDDLKINEIADVMNLTPSNIKIKLYRTRIKLYKILEKKLGSDFADWK